MRHVEKRDQMWLNNNEKKKNPKHCFNRKKYQEINNTYLKMEKSWKNYTNSGENLAWYITKFGL